MVHQKLIIAWKYSNTRNTTSFSVTHFFYFRNDSCCTLTIKLCIKEKTYTVILENVNVILETFPKFGG